MSIQHKRLANILAVVAFILCIPLVAMLFSSEVNWKLGDFVVADLLLLGTDLLLNWSGRKIQKRSIQIANCLGILLLQVLIWAELAMGIVGTTVVGS